MEDNILSQHPCACYTLMHTIKNIALPDLKSLDKKDIKTGFEAISKYIKTLPDYPGRVPIVVVGGACSVLVLRNRKATKDIDYFVFNPDHMGLVGDASRLADRAETKRFPNGWISSDANAVAHYPGNETAFADSMTQNEILFSSDSLVVYAADWRYQLVNKMSLVYDGVRLSETNPPSEEREKEIQKNLDDALAILNLMLTRRSGQPIREAEVLTWYMDGQALNSGHRIFRIVNQAYQARYNVQPIV